MTDEIPAGYEPPIATSPFPDYVGTIYRKEVTNAQGEKEVWSAFRIKEHHVNAWSFAHGGLMAHLSECANASVGYEVGGPPVVAIELSTYFVRAPKLGSLLEIRAKALRRTKSLVFTEAHAFVGDELQFSSTSVQKVVGG